MKSLKVLLITLIALLYFSCNKSDDQPVDDIIHTEINKIITASNPDSITGTCKNLIFEIKELNLSLNTAIIRLNDEMILCDGFNNILTNANTGNVLPINDNQQIFKSGNWENISNISLDEFAGKGEKFIGYRSGFLPSGVTNYRYGWIKIELSSDKKTLWLIERATNHTENKPINTGQEK